MSATLLPILIRLAKQRVQCRDCHKRSMIQSNIVKKYCCISNTSKLKILSALASCSHRFADGYDELPAHLAFDEFKGVDRKLHFICLNGGTHEVINILRNRFKKVLLKYFG